LTKTGRRRKSAAADKVGSPTDEPPGDGGPDEATEYIAETVAELARRHKLDLLGRLLKMAQMEAEERVRLRGKRKLS
jgi:hypothetical protein